ncbi:MAG: chloride channel protein, partial [Thermodesulfovibrionales bacterium]
FVQIFNKIQARIPGSGHTTLIAQAFIIGILAGCANILFRTTLDLVNETIFIRGQELLQISRGGSYKALLPLLPMTGALLLIPFSLLFPGEVNGYGFSRFLENVHLKGGVMKVRNIFLKIIGPALTIGSGGSAGVEGPIAVIGGTVGSTVGQLFAVSGSRIKVLIAAGAAGAIAATFNAPIAGIMFAMEIVLLSSYELSSFSAIVISSGVATVLSRSHYGSTPAFAVPQYDLRSPLEIPLYIILGVIVGVLAVVYIRLFYRISDEFQSLQRHPLLKPVTGAFLVGTMGIFLPHTMGNGYEFIEDALSGKIIFPVIFVLIFVKMIATSITLGSGGAGGVFAPSLFIGAMTGGSFGSLVHALFPSATASPGAYATVGIGAFLAAATHAPLTGIFLLFEMTGNYKIIVPVMFASIIGVLVSRKLSPDSIDTFDLARRGIRLHEGKEMKVMGRVKVSEIMRGYPVTVGRETSLRVVVDTMIKNERFYLPVMDHDGLLRGIVSFQDVRPILFLEKVKDLVMAGEIATEELIVLFPEHDLNEAMKRFSLKDIDEIPVVDAAAPRKLIGMVSRGDVISAYNREILKEGESVPTG